MSARNRTNLFICRTCRPDGFAGADTERPGYLMAQNVLARAEERGVTDTLRIKAVDCLSVCKRPCTVAVTARGKFAYLVGDLDATNDVDDVIDFALGYKEAPDGITKWRERPQIVRKNTVARVPPPDHDDAPVSDVPDRTETSSETAGEGASPRGTRNNPIDEPAA